MSVMDTFRLDGKTALVTGGSKGLGQAMAQALAEAGADVALCSRHLAEAEETAQAIAEATGRRTFGFETDVTSRASVEQLAKDSIAALGKVDILVNNAGINIRNPLEQTRDEDWDAVMDISVKGSYFCTQAFLPAMMERKWGRVIMLGSIMSYISLPGRGPYATAKAGLLGLTRTLALEAAQHGVTVNCICPGPFGTPMNRVLLQDPKAYEMFLSRIPMGRWGEPEELGGTIVYLCSDASAFVTGTSIVIDGGWMAQ